MIDCLNYVFIFFTTKSLKIYEYGKMIIEFESQKEFFKHFSYKNRI